MRVKSVSTYFNGSGLNFIMLYLILFHIMIIMDHIIFNYVTKFSCDAIHLNKTAKVFFLFHLVSYGIPVDEEMLRGYGCSYFFKQYCVNTN